MVFGMGNNNNSGGTINLSKGAKINLSKETPGLKKIMIGLGWDPAENASRHTFDLDASVFLVGENGRASADGFIFYNNLKGPNDCVVHQGDNRDGVGDGDDEQIYVDLDLVPENVSKIAITVTIDAAEQKYQNFGMVENSFCRLVNTETDKEEIRYDLAEDFSTETALVIAELYRHKGDWKFNAVGQGFNGGLLALCRNYGLDAEYKD